MLKTCGPNISLFKKIPNGKLHLVFFWRRFWVVWYARRTVDKNGANFLWPFRPLLTPGRNPHTLCQSGHIDFIEMLPFHKAQPDKVFQKQILFARSCSTIRFFFVFHNVLELWPQHLCHLIYSRSFDDCICLQLLFGVPKISVNIITQTWEKVCGFTSKIFVQNSLTNRLIEKENDNSSRLHFQNPQNK